MDAMKRVGRLTSPQYRLRVGELRVFRDASEKRVDVFSAVQKSQVVSWLESRGKANRAGGLNGFETENDSFDYPL
jgi:hypothetical protein